MKPVGTGLHWPDVLPEDETLNWVIAGASIARFGDGEFNLCVGQDCITQPYNLPIASALKKILREPSNCLVGIPRLGLGPKHLFWARFHRPDIWELFGQNKYVSAFITRPDSAPWIDRPEYWSKVRSLWIGKNVTLVRGSDKSLTASMLKGAASVREIIAPKRNAFASYTDLMRQIGTPQTALLCLGPTATVMAHDLSRRGVHAIDIGHIGLFLAKHLAGKPMVVTAKDKAVDRMAG